MNNRTQSSRLEAFVPGRVVLGEHELSITMRYLRSPWTRYVGCRRAIEELGLVPTSIEWSDGYPKYTWQGADGLLYRLSRVRPEGAKGPRRNFLMVDNWELLAQTAYCEYDRDQIRAKERELAAFKHRRSPEGRAAWNKEYDRCLVAKADHAFQTMLESILPIIGGRHDA